MNEDQHLSTRVHSQIERLRRAQREHPTVIRQTIYLGALGIMFIIPVISGAYLGRWLDQRLVGYAIHWTISLIFLGIILGAVNVYLFVKE